jgi:ribonuclease PH
MALNKTVLSALIKSKIEAATGGTLPAQSLAAFTALADAIITHLTTTGVITVVTTCPSGAGTGTGTIT